MSSYQKNSKAFKWQYRLVEEGLGRMTFILPRKSLIFIALLGLALGLIILFNPQWLEEQPQFMATIAAWGGISLGLSLLYFVMTRSGEISIVEDRQLVTVSFRSPNEHVDFHLPFSDFESIETRQVKDMHGLHNHWSIELVTQNDLRIKIGASFNGTFRKKTRDRLVHKISEIMEIPVQFVD